MAHQILNTAGDDELIVMSRLDYDALLAAAGDADAEERVASRIADAARSALASGEEILLPDWLVYATLDGKSPLQAIRDQAGVSREHVSDTSGVSVALLQGLEDGTVLATEALRDKLAVALAVPPGWLEPV